MMIAPEAAFERAASEMGRITQAMLNIAVQARATPHQSPFQEAFMREHAKLVELIQTVQPTTSDSAALASLHLLSHLPTTCPFPVEATMRSNVGVPRFCSPVAPKPRIRKYKVINPRTGEEITISSTVPFHQRQTKRLRILDPRTGEEVLPEKKQSVESEAQRIASVATPFRAGASRRDSDCGRRDSSSTTRRDSCGEVVSSRRSRASLAGRAVREGSAWTLEPASGGHWDWPLSRQEKKDRVLLLSQLELLAELEELRDEAGY